MSDRPRDGFGAALALADRLLLRHRKLFPFDRIVAEHEHGAGHLADLVLGVGRGNVHAAVPGGELLHRACQVSKRPCDAAPDQPVKVRPSAITRNADADNQKFGLFLRCGDACCCCCALSFADAMISSAAGII